MAINFPLSLDSLSNPSSGNKLDNPSHSTQHGDANDILEALETKLGIGASSAGSATAGFPLVHSSGGTTAWAQVGYEGITSGTATSGQVLTAGTATGSSIWSTPSVAGLTQIVPTSVAVGSGSGSVDANGAVTFTGASSISLNSCFTSNYQNYRIVANILGAGAGGGGFGQRMRLRASGTDNSASNYRYAGYGLGDASASNIFKVQSNGTTTSFLLEAASSQAYSYKVIDVFMPFETENTSIQYQGMYVESTPQFFGYDMGGIMSVTTSYDGFTLFTADAGTSLGGTIRVYGYKN
jgi:hypothetical protein